MYIEPRLPDHTDIWTANLNSRIVHCFGEIEENMAESIVAQLLYLDAKNHEDIQFYINSYGGDVTAGLAIYDTLQHIQSDVRTICVGKAMSMGAVLLSGGTKGKRSVLPNATVICDCSVADDLPWDVDITQADIDFERCFCKDGISLLLELIPILFFDKAFSKENELKDEYVFGDTTDKSIKASDFKTKYAKLLKDTSKVQFLMDTVGISEIEARFLLVLYRCETIRPLAHAFECLRPISNLAIEEILELSSKDFNSITHKNSKLRAYGFLDKEKNLDPDLKECITSSFAKLPQIN